VLLSSQALAQYQKSWNEVQPLACFNIFSCMLCQNYLFVDERTVKHPDSFFPNTNLGLGNKMPYESRSPLISSRKSNVSSLVSW